MKKLLLVLPLLLGAILLFAKTTAPHDANEAGASMSQGIESATVAGVLSDECDPKNFTTEICQLSTGELIVTIRGVKVYAPYWTLHKALDCAGGVRPDNFDGAPLTIQWSSPGKIFTLPNNSGCYILSYVFEAPNCPPVTVSNLINTDVDFIQPCDYQCDTWDLVIKHLHEIPIHAGAISSTPFPSGTLITFTINNKVVQTGANPYYTFGSLELGTHIICVTVARPDCPQLTKCETIYMWERPTGTGSSFAEMPHGQHVESRTAQKDETMIENLRFSNPSYSVVYFSQPIGQGNATIFSSQGTLIKSFELSDTNQLDVSDVATGSYLLVVKTPEQVISKLLLIATPK